MIYKVFISLKAIPYERDDMTTQKAHYEASGEGIVHIFAHGC